MSTKAQQLVQVQQLGLLSSSLQDLLDNYLPQRLNNQQSASITQITLANDVIENFKPSISDQIKVGFYSTDRFTQTNESDIIPLKAATETLDSLCNEMDSVKYDLKFTRDSLKSQFEQELQEKTIELHGKMNEKLKNLKREQDEALERIRHAYRSQLSNALSRVGKIAQEQTVFVMKQAKLKDASKNEGFEAKYKELQKIVLDQEATIESLRSELRDSKDKNKFDGDETQYDQLMQQLKDERAKAVEESLNSSKKIGRLEEAVTIKEEETDKLLGEVANLQLQLEKEKILTEQLRTEIQETNLRNENERLKTRKDFEKQKLQIESKMNDKLRDSRNQMMNAAKSELAAQEDEARRKRRDFEEQERELKERLALAETLQREKEKEAETNSKLSKKEDLELIGKLKRNELYLKADLARLNRELERNNQNWEKKFEILKKSLHAIKDEMYLRQNLQKQSVHLSYASVAYSMNEAPIDQFGTQEINQTNVPRNESSLVKGGKQVLPSINTSNSNMTNKNGLLERQLSFTISVPSRLSGHLDADETQIVDDDEMDQLKQDYLKNVQFIQPSTLK